MAGGIGSRFWPVSTSEFPKQFHDILGTGETLIQQTYRRLLLLSKPEQILVVTHKNYVNLVQEQLPDLPIENIIAEPARRNTAPCITYAAYRIQAQDPTAVMVVAPADHLISNEAEFSRVALLACENAESNRKLFTLGIKPHRPDTGYGYIQFVDQEDNPGSEIKVVKTFTEKPDIDLAKEFVESGEFLWNSGIFIWSVPTFMEELNAALPDMYSSFEAGIETFGTTAEQAFINEMYPACENESIDYGLMEKSEHVNVIPADFGWSDLGTWGSLHEHARHDENNNSALAAKALLYDTKDSVVFLPKNKLAVIEGLENFIVVDQGNTLLICRKDNEQLIKSFVSDLKLKFGDKVS